MPQPIKDPNVNIAALNAAAPSAAGDTVVLQDKVQREALEIG